MLVACMVVTAYIYNGPIVGRNNTGVGLGLLQPNTLEMNNLMIHPSLLRFGSSAHRSLRAMLFVLPVDWFFVVR